MLVQRRRLAQENRTSTMILITNSIVGQRDDQQTFLNVTQYVLIYASGMNGMMKSVTALPVILSVRKAVSAAKTVAHVLMRNA